MDEKYHFHTGRQQNISIGHEKLQVLFLQSKTMGNVGAIGASVFQGCGPFHLGYQICGYRLALFS